MWLLGSCAGGHCAFHCRGHCQSHCQGHCQGHRTHKTVVSDSLPGACVLKRMVKLRTFGLTQSAERVKVRPSRSCIARGHETWAGPMVKRHIEGLERGAQLWWFG